LAGVVVAGSEFGRGGKIWREEDVMEGVWKVKLKGLDFIPGA